MIFASRAAQVPALASVVAYVAHARSVHSAEREAFAAALHGLPEHPSRLMIHTCHRVELYVTVPVAGTFELPDLPHGGERLEDVAAVQHLISVACGLDSAVFGETQILHQIRELIEDRQLERSLDPVLDRLLQSALRAGREARTYFTGPPRSLADVALDRIAAFSGPIAGRRIVVVGAGRMARLAALAAGRRAAGVVVANRTDSRATALADDVGGTTMPFDGDAGLAEAAGVIVAIGGTWAGGDQGVASLRAGAIPVVDLSSPPAVSMDVQLALGDRFVSVDDLAESGEDGPPDRIRTRLDRLISRAGADYCQWLRARGSVPAIRAAVDTAEQRRRAELEWLRRRLPGVSDDDLALIDQMSHRLVAAILHEPLTALTADEDGDLERAARELFGL